MHAAPDDGRHYRTDHRRRQRAQQREPPPVAVWRLLRSRVDPRTELVEKSSRRNRGRFRLVPRRPGLGLAFEFGEQIEKHGTQPAAIAIDGPGHAKALI